MKLIMRTNHKVGIIGWGGYIPKYRLKVESIAEVWGKDAARYKKGLYIKEKAVAGPDEDAATIAVEAAKNAILRAKIDPSEIGAIFVGSESKPYAVKPTGTIVGEAIGATPNILAADFEFACKAGTEAIQCCIGLTSSGMIKYGLAIGADVAQGAPGDDLEFAAAAGGAAYVLGRVNSETVATIEASYSYVTDTPDFWRRSEQPFPMHGEGFTGTPAYFRHVVSAANTLMNELGKKPSDFDYVVFHQPNGKFPIRAAKILGFTLEQLKPGLLTPEIGNTYSGATPLGLAAILDIAKPGDEILAVSYGSGAGSDAFYIVVEDAIEEKKDLAPKISDFLKDVKYVGYSCYLKWRRSIIGQPI
ncbi:MAG: hydroxymethylglutaryl-CoA synthase [Candidatus Odinarchaeia archaeon]